jgi:hypothetical protein
LIVDIDIFGPGKWTRWNGDNTTMIICKLGSLPGFSHSHIGSRIVEGYEEMEGESLETALFVLLPVCTVHIDISLFDQSSFLSPSFELLRVS